MPIVKVRLPTREVLEMEVPDGTSQDEINAAAKDYMAQKWSEKSFGGKVLQDAGENARVVPSALYEAFTSLPRLGVELGKLAGKALPEEWRQLAVPPLFNQISKADNAIRDQLSPVGGANTVARDVLASGIGGATFPGGTTALQGFKIGLGGGAGAEIGGALTQDSFLGKLLGAILGGGGTALALSHVPTKEKLAKEALEGVTDQDLGIAKLRMEKKAAQGVPSNLSQNMPANSNIDAYVNALAADRQGVKTREVLNAQPAILASKTQQQVQSLPGTVLPQRILANEAQDAATAVEKQYVQKAGEAWRKTLGGAEEEISQKGMASFMQQLKDLQGKVRGDSQMPAAQGLEELRKRLTLPPEPGVTELYKALGIPAPEKYVTNALDIKAIIRDIADNGYVNLKTSSKEATDAYFDQQTRLLWKNMLDQHAPKLKAADAAYEAVRNDLNVVKKSVTGDIAGTRGALPDVNAPQGKLMALFDKGTTPGTASEILTLERDFRKAGRQEEFVNAATTWIADRARRALAQGEASSRAPEKAAEKLLNTFGDPRGFITGNASPQAQGLRDALAGIARARGESEQTYVKGFTNLMEIVTDLARRPGSTLSAGNVAEAAIPPSLKAFGNVTPLTPLRQPALWLARKIQAGSLAEMDKLFNSPEGIAVLKALAANGKDSPASAKALAAFAGANASMQAKNE